MRQPITEALRRLLERKTRDGRTIAELLAETILRKALAGDLRFIKLILDRTEGPVTRRIPNQAPRVDPIFIIQSAEPARPSLAADPAPPDDKLDDWAGEQVKATGGARDVPSPPAASVA
jgi:hypothetical protein